MPKVSVYLPDDLYQASRDADLPISTLTQEAIREALRRRTNRAWIDRARARSAGSHGAIDTVALLDEVREEFGR